MSDIVLGIRLTADGKDLVGAVKVSSAEIDKMTGSTKRAGSESERLNGQQKRLGETLNSTASRIGLYSAAWNKAVDAMFRATGAVKNYFKEAGLLNARFETLGVAMVAVGRNVGYTAAQMQAATLSLQKTGISMVESRASAMRLVQAHIDLSHASRLARIAQDAAVIGNINSSEAFGRLVRGIQTAEVETLRNMGINVNFEQSYQRMAAQLGKNTDALTDNDKSLARLNAVMEKGDDIAGTYEAAMSTAAKQLLSMQRYSEDLKVKLGGVFNETLTVAVFALSGAFKSANGEFDEMAANKELEAWGETVADNMAAAADNVMNLIGAMRILGHTEAAAAALAANIFNPEARAAIQESYSEIVSEIAMGEDRFQKALAKRRAARAEHAAAEEAAARAQGENFTRILNFYAARREAGLMAEVDYVRTISTVLMRMYGDNHKYADTPGTSTGAKGSDPYAALLKNLKEKLLLDKESTELERLAVTLSEKKYAALGKEKKATLENLAREVDAKNQSLAADKATLESTKFQIEQRDKNDEALNAFNTTMSEHLQQIEFETELYAKTEEQKQIAIGLRKLDAEYVKAQIGLDKAHLATLTAIYEARRAQLPQAIAANNAARIQSETSKNLAKDLERGQVDAWKSIDRTAHDTFVSIFDSGKSVFDRLRDTLKNGLYSLLYQMTLKKWIINLSGAVSGAGVASSAFGASGGGLNLLSSASNLAGAAGIFGSAGAYAAAVPGLTSAAAGSQAAMLAAQTGAFGAEGLALTSAAGGSTLGGGISAAMAAIPGWGWAALGAAAIGAYLLSDEGDAQRQGNWSARLGQVGGSDSNRWFSGDEMGASLAAFGQTLAASEQQIISTLKLSADQVSAINAALDAQSAKQYGFGMEHTDWQQSGAAQAIAADRLRAIADTLGQTVEELAQDLTAAQKALELAPAKRQLEIRLLEASGDAVGALAARRKDELAATDALLRPLLEQIYAAEDLAAAANDATGAVRTLAQQIDDLRAATSSAVDDQISASRSAAQAARSAADAYRGLNATLADTVRQLRGGDLSPLLPGQKLAEARAQLNTVYGKAATGDAGALAALPQVATDFLAASRAYNASSAAYTADFNRVMGLLAQAEVASTAMANHQDYQATLLEIQTGVLEDIKAELASPSPDTDLLREQAAILSTIAASLQAQTMQIVAGNAIVQDQTGKIILGNALTVDQTGKVALGNSWLAQQATILSAGNSITNAQTGTLLAGSYAVRDNVGALTNVTIGQTGQLLGATGAQTGSLLAGRYSVIDPQTGQLVGLTVGQSGIITASNSLLTAANRGQGVIQTLLNGQTAQIIGGNLVLKDQSGLIISSNTLLKDQAGKIVAGNTLVSAQTGQIITGNATQSAIKNLSSLNTSYSENMLAALVDSGGVQSGSLQAIVLGNTATVSLLQQLVSLQGQAQQAQQAATSLAWEEQFKAYAGQLYTQMRNETLDLMRSTGQGYNFDLGSYDAAIAAWKITHPAPQFASGGVASGWSIVGEEGPELVNFAAPGRVYTADQTRDALGASGDNKQWRDEQSKLARETLATTQESADRQVAALREGLATLQEEFAALRTELRRLTT